MDVSFFNICMVRKKDVNSIVLDLSVVDGIACHSHIYKYFVGAAEMIEPKHG